MNGLGFFDAFGYVFALIGTAVVCVIPGRFLFDKKNHAVEPHDPTQRQPLPFILVIWAGRMFGGAILAAESKFRTLARKKMFSILLVGFLCTGAAAAVSIFVHTPIPWVHDEFSYLLAADTFAHGRLTNPTHPQWQHFESFHILQTPTYASKFPPAQGMFMAMGKIISGHPIVGVWLSFGFCCAAIYWMLRSWVPPGWALFGIVLAALRLGFLSQWLESGPFGYWSQSYWGGAVAAGGGALFFGALRRLWNHPRPKYGFIMGIGLAVLANSRPYEGFVVALPAAGLMAYWVFKKSKIRLADKKNVVFPLLAIMAVTFIFMGYYNWRVTGRALKMPYQEYEQTYGIPPLSTISFQPFYRTYRHRVIKEHYHWSNRYIEAHKSWYDIVNLIPVNIRMMVDFYFGAFLGGPLLLLSLIVRDKWMRYAAASLAFLLLAMTLTPRSFPHYTAPAASLLFALQIEGMRRIRRFEWQGKRVGLFLIGLFFLIPVVSLAVPLSSSMGNYSFLRFMYARKEVVSRLESQMGQQLVIVRYKDDHNVNNEWVYNDADIDGSKIVWAREMGGEADRQLLQYFQNRRAWLLEPDFEPPKLMEYVAGSM